MVLASLLLAAGCTGVPQGSTEKNDLAAMRTVSIEIRGRTTYISYVADTQDKQTLGLMNVTEADLAADHGMIFVFSSDRERSFWMRNVLIPVDIAYIRSDGTIVKTYTMEPLNEAGYPSIEPARFALEVHGGQLARWGIRAGDHVQIPSELLD